MNQLIEDTLKGIAEHGAFAILFVKTQEGGVDIRPIGSAWGNDIMEAIREMDAKHPDCKFRLYEHNYDDWRRYFEGVVGRDRLM